MLASDRVSGISMTPASLGYLSPVETGAKQFTSKSTRCLFAHRDSPCASFSSPLYTSLCSAPTKSQARNMEYKKEFVTHGPDISDKTSSPGAPEFFTRPCVSLSCFIIPSDKPQEHQMNSSQQVNNGGRIPDKPFIVQYATDR